MVTTYVITVVPAETPATTPVLPTVATAVLLLLQVPPEMLSISVMVLPAQTVDAPEMDPADGAPNTVMWLVAVPEEVV